MINLKLAEYKNGKFQGFLELAKADYQIRGENKDNYLSYGSGFILGKNSIQIVDYFDEYKEDIYLKDEKDPLNRFDGLFDGRTYGEGRFVLILNIEKIFQDDVLKSRWLGGDLEVASNQPIEDRYYFLPDEVIGNLHENPELYEKINK